MSLSSYLERHFVDKATFAGLAGISVERLDQLVGMGAVPSPTYVCRDSTISSAVFGQTEINEPLQGEYFRPECLRWVRIAAHADSGKEREAVLGQLTEELEEALRAADVEPSGIQSRIQNYLPNFWNGTFGLCVADPSTGAGIVTKELLQERLTSLTGNGRDPAPAGITKTGLLALIDDYAKAAMPFSPAEYARSSRKRLVDDLRPGVAAA